MINFYQVLLHETAHYEFYNHRSGENREKSNGKHGLQEPLDMFNETEAGGKFEFSIFGGKKKINIQSS